MNSEPEIPLAPTFTSGGFNFRMLRREGDVALLSKVHRHGRVESYEVVRIQHRRAKVMPNGKPLPAREAMPASEQWGTAGWTYPDLASAERRFAQLLGSWRALDAA
jgi:hypothetical protein